MFCHEDDHDGLLWAAHADDLCCHSRMQLAGWHVVHVEVIPNPAKHLKQKRKDEVSGCSLVLLCPRKDEWL